MMRLVRVELARLVARRAVLLTVLLALAVGLVAVAGVFQQARAIDQARAGFDAVYQQMADTIEEDIERCKLEEEFEREQSGEEGIDFGCDEIRLPTIEEYAGQMPSLVEQYQSLLGAFVYPLMFLALALGSTAVAAEFAHRTMGTWLTFEPRRTLVFVSKVVAPVIAAVPIALVGLTTVLIGVPAVFRWFRIDDGITAAEWGSIAAMSGRIVGLTLLAAAAGAALAFLVRHSGLVIGILVGYLVVGEGLLGLGLGFLSRFSLGRNIIAVVQDGTTWTTWPLNCGYVQDCREIVHRVSLGEGVALLGVVLGVLMLLGWWRFVRSDID